MGKLEKRWLTTGETWNEKEEIQDTIGNQIRWVMHNLPTESMKDYDTNFEGNRISFSCAVNLSQ